MNDDDLEILGDGWEELTPEYIESKREQEKIRELIKEANSEGYDKGFAEGQDSGRAAGVEFENGRMFKYIVIWFILGIVFTKLATSTDVNQARKDEEEACNEKVELAKSNESASCSMEIEGLRQQLKARTR